MCLFFWASGCLPVRECASDLSTALDKEKNYALTRSAMVDCYMELVCENNAYYVRYYQPRNAYVRATDSNPWIQAEEEKIGKGTVTVLCETSDAGSIKIEAGKSVKFVYDRITGAFKKIMTSDGTALGTESGDKVTCEKITIKSGRTYEITIYEATGKHKLERTS